MNSFVEWYINLPWASAVLLLLCIAGIVAVFVMWADGMRDPLSQELRAMKRRDKLKRKLFIVDSQLDSAHRTKMFSVGRDIKRL